MDYIMNFIKSCYEFFGHTPTINEIGGVYVVLLFFFCFFILYLQNKYLKKKKNDFLSCKIKY